MVLCVILASTLLEVYDLLMILNYLHHQIKLYKIPYICEHYAQECDITFNGAKSQLLVFRSHDCKVVTSLCKQNIILLQDNKITVEILMISIV